VVADQAPKTDPADRPHLLPAIAANPYSHVRSESECFKQQIIKGLAAASRAASRLAAKQKRQLRIVFSGPGAVLHTNDLKLYLALVSSDWGKNYFKFLSFEQRAIF
jgi:hypothetical protein